MSVYELFRYLGAALGITMVVELLIVLALERKKSYIPSILVANVVTNPLLNLLLIIFTKWMKAPYGPVLFILEVLVWITEAFIVMKMNPISKRKAISLSLVMNAASYLVGVFIQI